ncbi:MAG: 50S ribosomal protein L10 [Eggerthellaceae bacterium]|nr:50S ribosomal protein L10 [Eggerthellaceae bacterium]
MPNAQNVESYAALKEDLSGVSAMWIVNYRGLTVKESEELRRAIRQADATMVIYKNSLVHIALEELSLPNCDEVLNGPSAFVFAKGDPVSAAKALKNFAKTHKVLELKGGMMDGQFMNADQAQAVANLPSRDELLAKLLGTISNPMSKIARVVSEIAKQKEAAA